MWKIYFCANFIAIQNKQRKNFGHISRHNILASEQTNNLSSFIAVCLAVSRWND